MKLDGFGERGARRVLDGLPCASSRLPLRSRLKTARNSQPWPWKSANCVCFSCGLNSRRSPVFSQELADPTTARAARCLRGCASRSRRARRRRQLAAGLRIHLVAVGLVVPPREAQVAWPPCSCPGACGRSCTGWSGSPCVMHVLDRMARLVLRDHRRSVVCAQPAVAGLRVLPPSAPASGRWRRRRGRPCSRRAVVAG